MFDWLWRGLGYTLKKDIRKQYIDKKMLEDADLNDFVEKCKNTPSFSKCAIPSLPKSQKQKHQIKSYKNALKKALVEADAPPVPTRVNLDYQKQIDIEQKFSRPIIMKRKKSSSIAL
tara:strand:+ start:715 stop:1065 length:351 start_codon:yes stop_codon:yes gene_type:complete